MGDYFQTIVDLDASAAEAPRLAARVVDRLVAEGIVSGERTDCVLGKPLGHRPGPNWHRAVAEGWEWKPDDGLAVHTERTVFDSGQGDPESATCPRCGTTTDLDAEWSRFSTAISAWHDTGTAAVDCPACGVFVPLPDWTWADDYFAFGHLGFEFWNWPEVTPEFRARISELLGGHRTAYMWGKL